jgi:hypothetical protein
MGGGHGRPGVGPGLALAARDGLSLQSSSRAAVTLTRAMRTTDDAKALSRLSQSLSAVPARMGPGPAAETCTQAARPSHPAHEHGASAEEPGPAEGQADGPFHERPPRPGLAGAAGRSLARGREGPWRRAGRGRGRRPCLRPPRAPRTWRRAARNSATATPARGRVCDSRATRGEAPSPGEACSGGCGHLRRGTAGVGLVLLVAPTAGRGGAGPSLPSQAIGASAA